MHEEEPQIRKIDLLRKQRREQMKRIKTVFYHLIKYSVVLAIGLFLLNFAWPLIAFAAGTILKVIAALIGFLFFLVGICGFGILLFGKNKKVL